MASKIDRMERLLETRETFFQTRVPLPDGRCEFVRKGDAHFVDIDPRRHQARHRRLGLLTAGLPEEPRVNKDQDRILRRQGI